VPLLYFVLPDINTGSFLRMTSKRSHKCQAIENEEAGTAELEGIRARL
jgi:hypothetical protein